MHTPAHARGVGRCCRRTQRAARRVDGWGVHVAADKPMASMRRVFPRALLLLLLLVC